VTYVSTDLGARGSGEVGGFVQVRRVVAPEVAHARDQHDVIDP